MISRLKQTVRATARRLGFDIVPYHQAYDPVDEKCEGFDGYLQEAKRSGADVNEWIEATLNWEPALPALERVVYPYLRENSVVCEIGPGTGRHARHILTKLPNGQLHLFDHSTWITTFLREYFSRHSNVTAHLSVGDRISLADSSADLCFSNGTFIELKLGSIFLLAHEFRRILRDGGFVVFDYIDITRAEGWAHLAAQSREYSDCFTYHAAATLDKLFDQAGFDNVARHPWGKSVFVVYRKRSQA